MIRDLHSASTKTSSQTDEWVEDNYERRQHAGSCHKVVRAPKALKKSEITYDTTSAQSESSFTLCAANDSLIYMPFDERVSQSLVGRAVALQQPQLALSFVMASFPCYFKATESRVPMTWIDYISQRHSKYSQNVSCFDWAVRCMTTIYLGSLHNDARYMDEGRMCYLRSLRGLSIILSDPRAAKSDEALSTVIILGVFEMHAYTSIEGWKHHARGLRTLMQLRGPGAHADGFGCNLYMACRNTIVTAALVSGEECFLEQPEWQQLNECLAAKNAKNANSSALEDIAERAFREVVKLPGFVKRLREMPGLAASAQNHERPALLRKIVATRTAMKGIYTEFVISASTVRAGFASYADFVGPIPHVFFHKFADLTIHGIRSGLLLLNYLVILLNPSQRPAAETEILDIMGSMRSPRRPSLCEGRDNLSLLSSTVPPQSLGELSLMIESRLIPEASQPPTSDWMDDIATSMGLEGVRISLVQSSSFQTIED